MDPLSQGVLGAIAPQAASSKKRVATATVCGFVAGMAPDLDILIRSSEDPLLSLEYHRQFTHSLFFVPIGGLICAALLWLVFFRRTSFKMIYLFSTLGYATHGLLDSCTSYGTQLFWPFSTMRVSWNNISIIDPLFTLPLFLFMLICFFREQAMWAKLGLIFAITYLSFGLMQTHRAEQAARTLAAKRNHHPVQVTVKPSFGNLLVFKSIYRHQNRYYIDAIRAGWKKKIFEGEAIDVLDIARDFPEIGQSSQTWRDIERFTWFSSGYVAQHPTFTDEIIDVRYSLIPNRIEPLWGIKIFRANANRHVVFKSYPRNRTSSNQAFLKMLFASD